MKLSTDRLYRRMELEAVTATQLAAEAGISRQAMYNILNARSQPRPATLARICEVLHCTPKSLLGRDEWDVDHTTFARVVVARAQREGLVDYDVKSAVVDYIHNWLAEQYNDLSAEQFEEVKDVIDEPGRQFAGEISDMLRCFEFLSVRDDTQVKATEEAFVSFFEVMPSMIYIVDTDPSFNIFDGEEYE